MKTTLQNLKKQLLTVGLVVTACAGINAQCATSTNITYQGSGNISLMNQSAYTGGWDSYVSVSFGDGNSTYGTGTSFNSTHQYSSNGIYLVVSDLFAYNPADSSFNCSYTDYDTVVVNDVACSITTTPISSVQDGGVFDWSFYSSVNSSQAIYQSDWVITDSLGNYLQSWSGTNNTSVTYTFPASGFYNIGFSVLTYDSLTATYCSDSTYTWINVGDSVVPTSCNASFYMWEDSTNAGVWYAVNNSSGGVGALTYMWDFGDGSSSTLAYPTHNYATAGNYIICLTIADANGCTSSTCDSTSRISQHMTTNGVIGSLTVMAPTVGIAENHSVLAETKIFPNPMTETSSVTFNSSLSANGTIEVVNVLGAKVLSENVIIAKGNNEFKLNTASLANGVYYVNITAENRVLTTIKAVK